MTAILRLGLVIGSVALVGPRDFRSAYAPTSETAATAETVPLPRALPAQRAVTASRLDTFVSPSKKGARTVEALVTLSTDEDPSIAALSVTGLEPDQAVQIGYGLLDSEYDLYYTAVADRDGRLRWQAPVAEWLLTEDLVLVLVVADGKGALLAVSNPLSFVGSCLSDEPPPLS